MSRSSQVLMFFGLPLRVTIVTTEPNGDALVLAGVPVLGDQARVDELVTSGSTEKFTTSVARPAATLRDWSPDAP